MWAVAGSLLFDATKAFFVWQRGYGPHMHNRLPTSLTVTAILQGMVIRGVLAAMAAWVLADGVDAITTETAAVSVGVALPEVLAAFANIRDNGVTAPIPGTP